MHFSAFKDSLAHQAEFNTAELVQGRAKKEVNHTWLYQVYMFCLHNAKILVQRRDKKNFYLFPSLVVLITSLSPLQTHPYLLGPHKVVNVNSL